MVLRGFGDVVKGFFELAQSLEKDTLLAPQHGDPSKQKDPEHHVGLDEEHRAAVALGPTLDRLKGRGAVLGRGK